MEGGSYERHESKRIIKRNKFGCISDQIFLTLLAQSLSQEVEYLVQKRIGTSLDIESIDDGSVQSMPDIVFGDQYNVLIVEIKVGEKNTKIHKQLRKRITTYSSFNNPRKSHFLGLTFGLEGKHKFDNNPSSMQLKKYSYRGQKYFRGKYSLQSLFDWGIQNKVINNDDILQQYIKSTTNRRQYRTSTQTSSVDLHLGSS